MDANFSLCLTCLKYCSGPGRAGREEVSPITDVEATAKDFAVAVNELRWDQSASSPKEDGPWVVTNYYNKFFFNYSTIFYTRQEEPDYWIDFPALAKARVQAERRYRDMIWTTPKSQPRKTWWFGKDGSQPSVEIEHVDGQNRYIVARFQHWREWGDSAIHATGGAIQCQLVRLANPMADECPVRVVRYWHDWMKKDAPIPERDQEIANLMKDLRQRAFSFEELAPLRNQTGERICVFGANEDIRTHLIVETLRKANADVRAVFVGRVAAYPFETLLQVSLRTAMHFPVCIADLSAGAGTPLEVQAVLGAGKIVAGLHPRGHPATQFLKDNEIYGRSFQMFAYDWPTERPREFDSSHVRSLVEAVTKALAWAGDALIRTTDALKKAFPWREYEMLRPEEAIKFNGECSCET